MARTKILEKYVRWSLAEWLRNRSAFKQAVEDLGKGPTAETGPIDQSADSQIIKARKLEQGPRPPVADIRKYAEAKYRASQEYREDQYASDKKEEPSYVYVAKILQRIREESERTRRSDHDKEVRDAAEKFLRLAGSVESATSALVEVACEQRLKGRESETAESKMKRNSRE